MERKSEKNDKKVIIFCFEKMGGRANVCGGKGEKRKSSYPKRVNRLATTNYNPMNIYK